EPGHDTNALAPALQHRALLDMGLEIGIDRIARRARARIADDLQSRTNTNALAILDPKRIRQFHPAGEYRRAQHGGRKPRPLLVGPADHFQWHFGFQAPVIAAHENLEAGEHAENTIITPASRLGVEMTAGHHGRALRVA